MLSVIYYRQNRLGSLSVEYFYRGSIHLELNQLHQFQLYALDMTERHIS
jgi:hypothetical protein